ncbi:MAG: group II intron maturase-specific domain-containing protein [Candidatus Aquicultor sp.]
MSVKETLWRLNQFLRGWSAYFSVARAATLFKELDKWIRRRLRCVMWKQWKRPRTRLRELRNRGLTGWVAYAAFSRKGPWRMSKSPALQQAIPNSFLESAGLISLHARYLKLNASRTAGCI